MLETQQLTFIYGAGTPFEHTAINGVDFRIHEGQCLGLIGHTGSGKSTLVQHLNGLLKPTSGKVLFEGRDIWEGKKSASGLRFKVGLVFQYPEYQLFEETVAADIAFGPKNMGLGADEIADRVGEAMEFVGLDAALSDKSPFEISGGQKRRVAIAGVIAMRPKVLILDEPTAGLDPAGRREILSHIKQYRQATGAAVVLVTHSMEDIASTVDDLTVLSDSKIVMSGSLREVFSRGDELEKIGLSAPAITRIMLRLMAMGVELDAAVYTVEDAARELLRVKGVPYA